MTLVIDWHLARALLEWQVELGVTDAVLAAPVDRLSVVSPVGDSARAAAPAQTAAPLIVNAAAPAEDAAALAAQIAADAPDLPTLAGALADFSLCDLKRGARTCVFADGNPKARVMIVGDGPGPEDDRAGLPFVGPAGRLLDQMFAAIGLTRSSPDPAHALYLTHALPWRVAANHDPTPAEMAMLRPFLQRHIALIQPDFLVLMGNLACEALLARRGIRQLRGTWVEAQGVPALPMLPPDDLLRHPLAKREAWADLLTLNARLQTRP